MVVGFGIRRIGPESLGEYVRIPISFRVESRLRVETINGGFGGFRLAEERVEEPYTKDYQDSILSRPEQMNAEHWHLLMAFDGDAPVGGAAVAVEEPQVNPFNCRDDVAVLWDIRVHPDYRGRGIGSTLFDRAAAWARERGYRLLAVETQNINVPACRFYMGKGCRLGLIAPCGYPDRPELQGAVMMVWCLDL
jgi:GNAT superfamily N-acetyltransferase